MGDPRQTAKPLLNLLSTANFKESKNISIGPLDKARYAGYFGIVHKALIMSENWPPTLFSAAHNLRSRQVNDCRPSRKDMFTQNVVNIQSYVFRVILACLSMAVSPSVTRIGRCKMLAYLALQQAQQEPLH